jgi:predicted transcriptional regulator
VRTRNGVDDDLRFENLIVTRHGRDPFGVVSSKHSKGGKASSLDHRAKTTTTLLQTLAEHPGATVPMLSRLVGSSASCTCTRLGKLSDAGLCIGPKCDARARWDLSQKGRELAARTIVVLDDLDHDILRIIARSQTKLMKIVAQTGVCRLTARRRVNLMVERKLIESDGRRFNITDEGRKALGDAAPQPWARPEPVAASLSRDVRTRLQHPNDDRSSWARAEQSSRARQKGIDKARENGQQPFIDPLSEFDRLRA